MSNYRLDRTQFEAFKAEERESDYSYWSQQSINERLEAANYLIHAAYGLKSSEFPKFDRSLFEGRKRL